MACRPGMPSIPGRPGSFFDPETGEIYLADPETGQPDCSSESVGNINRDNNDNTDTSGGVGIGGQLQALADALGVDIADLNDALGPSDYQKGLLDTLQEEFGDVRESFLPGLEGVNPALESMIAGQRNAATDRISGGLRTSGTVNSGARAVLETRASSEATRQGNVARLATQQQSQQGLLAVGGEINDFLQNLLNARSPLDRLIAGVPGTPPFSGQTNKGESTFAGPEIVINNNGSRDDDGGGDKNQEQQGTNDKYGFLPPGCHREFDEAGEPISVCN